MGAASVRQSLEKEFYQEVVSLRQKRNLRALSSSNRENTLGRRTKKRNTRACDLKTEY